MKLDVLKNNINLNKYNLKFQNLREICHLRPRTNTISCVARIRNGLAYATHQFFNSRGFLYVHTPLITASDCEGAGEMFQVTTVLPKPNEKFEKLALNKNVTIDLSANSPSVEMSWHCNNTKSSYFAKSVTNNNKTLKTGLNVRH